MQSFVSGLNGKHALIVFESRSADYSIGDNK